MSGVSPPLATAPPVAAPTRLDGATIVLDLDGTLVDSAPDIIATLNHLLGQNGHPPLPLAAARSMIGDGAWALLARGYAAAGDPLPAGRQAEMVERFIEHYRGRMARDSRPFPGAGAALDVLIGDGARLAVCTNKRTDLASGLLAELGLLDRFAAVIGGGATAVGKPDAAPLRLAIERAGGCVEQALMVGDSATDAGAARALGIPLVLVSFGYTATPARELGADAVIDRFDDLPAACRALLAPLSGRAADSIADAHQSPPPSRRADA